MVTKIYETYEEFLGLDTPFSHIIEPAGIKAAIERNANRE